MHSGQQPERPIVLSLRPCVLRHLDELGRRLVALIWSLCKE